MLPPKVSGLGVLFKTYDPISDLVECAALVEREGLHSFWLAEAYHWFRNYGGESRGAMVTAAAIACGTRRIPIGIGIVTPYTRHPTIIAMEAAALDEVSGGRLTLGLGVGKVGVNYLGFDLSRMTPVATHRESIEIIRGVLRGKPFEYHGKIFHATAPAVAPESVRYRPDLPIHIGATGPKMIELAGATADGLILPGLTTPGLVRYAREHLEIGARRSGRALNGFPVAAVIVCCISRDGKRARDIARPMVFTYLVNKLKNIQNQTLIDVAGLTEDDLAPIQRAIARGEAGDPSRHVSDEILRKTSVIAGTPEECVETVRNLAASGLTLPLLEVAWEGREETIRLAAGEVAPHVTGGR
jgi:5,10-methylenetetrahydromethanopterin reductase